MDNKQYALECFNKGLNCSQAVLCRFSEELGLSYEMALKISNGFGGGMKQAETCGAVTGALMVIGLKHGQENEEDKESKEKTYEFVKDFIDIFNFRNGTIICKELLDIDVSTEEGYAKAKEKELFMTLCPKYIKDGIEILQKHILND